MQLSTETKNTVTKIVRIKKSDVCYISNLFEAYEGLAVIRTLDPRKGILALWISSDFYSDVMKILESLKKEMYIEW